VKLRGGSGDFAYFTHKRSFSRLSRNGREVSKMTWRAPSQAFAQARGRCGIALSATAVMIAAGLFMTVVGQASPTISTVAVHGLRPRHGLRPPIIRDLIPFSPKRKRQMAAYSERHYGEHTWRLKHPHVIVEHWAEAGTAASVYNTFAPDHPDPELHELPNVCSHFVVSGSGRIFQLVSTRVRCRHTVGLNWTAIGIEHTGFSDGEVLSNSREMRASLALTRYLRCRFHITLRNVIGHAESLSSPYHRERVASLHRQTHGDWRHASMQTYRRRLRRLGSC
jgi:N-acetylmuramoyl-L-alanine amidase